MMFLMGVCVSPPRRPDEDLLVAWWLPGLSKERKFRQGRSKNVVDIFGKWLPMSSLPPSELTGTCMPETLVRQEDVLMINFELEDNQIPFATFNELHKKHGIDVTGFAYSMTSGGSLYRSHVLMGLGGS